MVLIRLVHTIDYLCSCQKFDCDFRWQLVLLASTPAEIHATNMNGYRKLCTAICHLHVVFDVHLRNWAAQSVSGKLLSLIKEWYHDENANSAYAQIEHDFVENYHK